MRLTNEEITAIKQNILNADPQAIIYLFGSRVDDNAKGGDIDLLIFSDTLTRPIVREIKLKLYDALGEQKIDLILAKEAPSILQAPHAKEVAVESFSLSKSYNMPGWRVGFMSGNRQLIGALRKIKSYLDYGLFKPIQIAAIAALESPDECLDTIRDCYRKRRDVLCAGLNKMGWQVDVPKATMFVWAKIPEQYRELKSLEFTKRLLQQAHVAVSPGIGFGEQGDEHVRFSLVEDEARLKQAVEAIGKML